MSNYLLFYGQLVEPGFAQALDQGFLCFHPDWMDQAIIAEDAVGRVADTFVEQDRPIDGLDHIQQGNILGIACQGNPAACARLVCSKPAMDNCEMILARKEGGIFISCATVLVAARWLGPCLAR